MTEESLETIHFFVEEHLEGDSGSLVAVVEVTGHPFRFVEGSKEGVELDLLFSSQLHIGAEDGVSMEEGVEELGVGKWSSSAPERRPAIVR